MARQHVTTEVNGEPRDFLCNAQETLLDVLRDELHLTGTKEGCSSGDCGACSVMVDGRLLCACLMFGVEAEGKKIETIEGMLKVMKCTLCKPNFSRKQHYSVASVRQAF